MRISICLIKFTLNWQEEIHSSHIDSLVRLISKFKVPATALISHFGINSLLVIFLAKILVDFSFKNIYWMNKKGNFALLFLRCMTLHKHLFFQNNFWGNRNQNMLHYWNIVCRVCKMSFKAYPCLCTYFGAIFSPFLYSLKIRWMLEWCWHSI